MNREIKFRAWHKEGRCMFSHTDLGVYNYHLFLEGETHLELMQYTGLKDKSGKKIYEGDVLRVDDGDDNIDYTATVEWGDDGVWLAVNNIEATPLGDMGVATFAQVIGNIYENQELMG